MKNIKEIPSFTLPYSSSEQVGEPLYSRGIFIMDKVCRKCNVKKELIFFVPEKRYKQGRSSYCRICINEMARLRHSLNNKRNEYLKKWRSENKDKVRLSSKKSYKKNKSIMNKKRAEYELKRKKIDPFFKLKLTLRSRIIYAFKAKNYSKNTLTSKLIGADINIVKNHIESKFKEGMNWDNHGQWHIDHIVPLSSAKTEKELYLLCNYTNLQPLWAIENLLKSNKL